MLLTRFARTTTNFLHSREPLSEEQMRQVAPAIFAEGAHESRGERYAYLPTVEALRALGQEGFQPFMVAQSRTRREDRQGFTKHMVRMRHPDRQNTSGEAYEVVLINSHDGSTSYQMLSGVLRFVCMNGMVVGENVQDVRVPHRGDARAKVVEGAFEVLDGLTRVVEDVDQMKALQLTHDEQRAFAVAAAELRFADRVAGAPLPVNPDQLLQARRMADDGDSLWLTFQRLQESTVRGGVETRTATGKRRTSRAVQGIDGSVGLNRALWVLAAEMRRLKQS